jgi:protein-disulfide isomerase
MSTKVQEPDLLRVGPDDHALGNPAAAIVLVEYGDYQCPLCTQVHPVIQALIEGMQHQTRFVWRHFPLQQAHPDALRAALAVEAADRQGLFWPMHDRVARHERGLDAAALASYAEAVGADGARFARDLAAPSAELRVRRDLATGELLEVRATPTFFLNGARFDMSYGVDRLQQELLKMARSGAPAGDRPS